MRISKPLLTIVTFLAGTAFLVPIIQANVTEWAKEHHYDQFLVDGEGPAMSWLAQHTQSLWFTFFLGFLVGGTSLLWLDYWLRGRGTPAKNVPATTNITGDSSGLAHGLYLSAMAVAVDKTNKRVQVGFTLTNATDAPLRYEVQSISVVLEGKTVGQPQFDNFGGSVARGASTTYRFPPIGHVMGTKSATAQASITYRYGRSGPDQPLVREANYRVSLTIGAKDHVYNILEENDGAL